MNDYRDYKPDPEAETDGLKAEIDDIQEDYNIRGQIIGVQKQHIALLQGRLDKLAESSEKLIKSSTEAIAFLQKKLEMLPLGFRETAEYKSILREHEAQVRVVEDTARKIVVETDAKLQASEKERANLEARLKVYEEAQPISTRETKKLREQMEQLTIDKENLASHILHVGKGPARSLDETLEKTSSDKYQIPNRLQG